MHLVGPNATVDASCGPNDYQRYFMSRLCSRFAQLDRRRGKCKDDKQFRATVSSVVIRVR
jgi:hypothetical protein